MEVKKRSMYSVPGGIYRNSSIELEDIIVELLFPLSERGIRQILFDEVSFLLFRWSKE